MITRPLKLFLAIAGLALAAFAAETPAPVEKSLSKDAADKIAALEQSEADATAKLQAVAGLILTPIQQQQQDVWMQACKDAGYPLAECRPDPKRRVVVHVVPEKPAK